MKSVLRLADSLQHRLSSGRINLRIHHENGGDASVPSPTKKEPTIVDSFIFDESN